MAIESRRCHASLMNVGPALAQLLTNSLPFSFLIDLPQIFVADCCFLLRMFLFFFFFFKEQSRGPLKYEKVGVASSLNWKTPLQPVVKSRVTMHWRTAEDEEDTSGCVWLSHNCREVTKPACKGKASGKNDRRASVLHQGFIVRQRGLSCSIP